MMKFYSTFLALFTLFFSFASAENASDATSPYDKEPLYGKSFVYSGAPQFYPRVRELLDEVSTYEVGLEFIKVIESHDNQVEIIHSPHHRASAGVTGAPLSRNLTNGVGEDVYIKMDFSIPAHGSHIVYDKDGNEIEFSALQIFFHELSHARHKSGGTWRYFDSEGQAIEDENSLRSEQAERLGVTPVLRSGIEGELRYKSLRPKYAHNKSETSAHQQIE